MEEKKPAHRPTIYTEELADKICQRRESSSLLQLCKAEDMPARSVVYKWLKQPDKKYFTDKYKEAVNTHTEKLFDELLEIADDGTNDYIQRENDDGSTTETLNTEHIQRSRLRTDVRKWYLSKVLPKKYGDKMDLTTDGEKITGIQVEVINSRNEDQSQSNQRLPEKQGSEEKTGNQ